MQQIKVELKRLEHNRDLPLPQYQTGQSAGLDLPAAVAGDMVIEPMQIAAVPTGLSIALPPGYEAQVRPRSGLAVKHGLTVVNAPGTIDADYRGEVKVALINLGPKPVTISRGDRIAQMIVAPVSRAELIEVEELSDTERGAGGFGHTGR